MLAKREIDRFKESSWFTTITMPFHIYASLAILLQRYIKFSIYTLLWFSLYIKANP